MAIERCVLCDCHIDLDWHADGAWDKGYEYFCKNCIENYELKLDKEGWIIRPKEEESDA